MNGVAVFATGIVSAGIVAAAITVPGINHARELDDLRSSCWSQNAQSTFTQLASGIVRDEVTAVAKGGGSDLTRQQIEKATSVKVRGFHTISIDDKAHAATCGASIDFTFTRADGKALHNNGAIVQFQIYPAPDGNIFSTMQGGVYRHIVESAQIDD